MRRRAILTGIHSIWAQSLRQPWPSLFVDQTMVLGVSVTLLRSRSECRPFFENQRTCLYIGLLSSLVEIGKRMRVLVREMAKCFLKFCRTPWIGQFRCKKLNASTLTGDRSRPLIVERRMVSELFVMIGKWRVLAAWRRRRFNIQYLTRMAVPGLPITILDHL